MIKVSVVFFIIWGVGASISSDKVYINFVMYMFCYRTTMPMRIRK